MIKLPPSAPAYWYGDDAPPLWARALTPLYAGITALRRSLFQVGFWRQRGVAAPVVVVGNLTVGGVGKTPLTIALVRRLQKEGYKPGVASRGYGRSDEAVARWVDGSTSVTIAGDEPVLIARRTQAPVRVDRNRAAAATALVEMGCDLVICDDGLQHYSLARDIEIEVIDGKRRYGNARLLPSGPLREPLGRGRRCDFHIVNLGQMSTDEPNVEPEFGEWPMRFRVNDAAALLGARSVSLDHFSGHRVHAVAGIGDPQRFFKMLRDRGIAIVPHVFPDHHLYRAEDLQFGSRLPILMTEKDAVKCMSFADEWYFSVPITAELPAAFWVAFLERLKMG
ncbi:MAG: tetraacyldisaccharide 4'-kinase [Xanthomonadaceae bacterium]|jgi:tetraacyldisaccharide 4'-kinase|nr:tetraacyldisaccharide 4'-kinase [Xanthomonadaceae bacterium]